MEAREHDLAGIDERNSEGALDFNGGHDTGLIVRTGNLQIS